MAWAPFTEGPATAQLEDLAVFRRWSLFLPQEACDDADRSMVYVTSRQAGNPKFFEQMREGLLEAQRDYDTQRAAGASVGDEEELPQALHLVLRAQWAAYGFHGSREFHKVLNLSMPCVDLVDFLAESGSEMLFWRALCRTNLGHAFLEFKKLDQARDVLNQAVELIEQSKAPEAREQVILGAAYAHLARTEWVAGTVKEALRYTDLHIELFERFLGQLLNGPDDREIQAVVLATAYSFRGLCDAHQEEYDSALAWYAKAKECVEKHKMVNKDALQIAASVDERVEKANEARRLQGIRVEYATKGGPLPV